MNGRDEFIQKRKGARTSKGPFLKNELNLIALAAGGESRWT
jgi:hypothetical protein